MPIFKYQIKDNLKMLIFNQACLICKLFNHRKMNNKKLILLEKTRIQMKIDITTILIINKLGHI